VRFLFDENLSESLAPWLGDIAPGSEHVRTQGHGGAPDARLWQLAADLACTIVTRDEDFVRMSALRGAPPKVIVIRLGNCSTRKIAVLLRSRHDAIERFLNDEDTTFLALG
jgi:predicted nuclease of predicted toxin-antitoxin system